MYNNIKQPKKLLQEKIIYNNMAMTINYTIEWLVVKP